MRNFGIIILIAHFALLGCVKSSSPTVSELIPTGQPSIDGLISPYISTSTSNYTVTGTCDINSYGLVYSVDSGATWTDVPGGCSSGTYSVTVLVLSSIQFWIRSKTQYSYTGTTAATIRHVLAPSSPYFTVVSAAGSPYSSVTQPKMSLIIPSFSTGTRNSALQTWNIDLHSIGIGYAQ